MGRTRKRIKTSERSRSVTLIFQSSSFLPLRCSQTESPLFISKPWMDPFGLELWYSRVREEGNMACSLSPPPSMSCSSSAWGKPNMKSADRKSKAPQSRKPPHHAPIQRGSSGVMSSLPEEEVEEFTTVDRCPITECWKRNFHKLTWIY